MRGDAFTPWEGVRQGGRFAVCGASGVHDAPPLAIVKPKVRTVP